MTSGTQTILGVNTSFGSLKYKDFEECVFDSTTSFMDYDAVVIDTESLARHYARGSWETYQGKLKLNTDDSFRIKEGFARTKGQISELLKQGKNVFILLANNENCFVYTGKSSISGTGRNAQRTNYVEEFDVFSFLPIKLHPTMVSGKEFNIVCHPPYSSFFQATKGLAYYDGFFVAPKKSTLLTVSNSDKAAAAVFEHEQGRIIVLPHPYVEANYKTKEGWKKFGPKYLSALFELNHALQASADSYALPLWTNSIKILNEHEEEIKLEQEEEKLRSIEAAIKKRQNRIQDIKRKKMLLAASGTPLEEVVKETLQEIGFTLHEAEVGRSDIVASYDGKDVVAEIKGVSKSAAEKHAAQLEKWVAQFIEKNDHSPKALLIVNGYCDTPLDERTEEVFPDQMLKYCNARNHALVTTTQLLCLYIEVKNNPACEKERITELLSCSGKYPRYKDFENYITALEDEVYK